MNKESYLSDYKEFIEKVAAESSTYEIEDWSKADEKFQKFSVEWKAKFKEEFTWRDELLLVKYELKYGFLSTKKESFDFFKGLFSDDMKILKDQLKEYSEKDMHEDILFIVEQSKEISEEAYKAVLEVMHELEIELEEIKQNVKKSE